MGDVCTEEQAEKWFLEDTAEAVAAVNRLASRIKVKLTQSMFDALVSLVYNAGDGPVAEGNGIHRSLTLGDYYQACDMFFEYRKQTNKRTRKKENVRGLALRRTKEMQLFLEDAF